MPKTEQGSRTPKVSVIMPVYNQMDADALNLAVDSILRQSMKDFEFIIYDDGSVIEAAQHIQDQWLKDTRIKICGVEDNRGLAFSLNACAELAKGQYIARMDADDIARFDRLEHQCRYLDTHPEIGWCGSNAVLFDGEAIWGSRVMPEYPEANDYLRYSPYIHPSVMYRRELLEKYHYSTKDEARQCEDYEIFMRLYRDGHRGCNIQEPLLCYRENKESYARRTLKRRLNEVRVRHENFRKLGILFPKGWLYVLRPIAGALAPNWMIAAIKKKESERAHVTSSKDRTISEVSAEQPAAAVGRTQVSRRGTVVAGR